MRAFIYFLKVLGQQCIQDSLKFAVPSAGLAAVVKITNDNLQWNYLNNIMPNDEAFMIFASLVSFLLVVRTVHALDIYMHGASAAYAMTGSWFDALSTLFAFTRCATAHVDDVGKFKNTLIRLFSLLSMFCLTELENCEDPDGSRAINFIVIDVEGLDPKMLQILRDSKCKAEAVFQIIQCLIVDNIKTGVLAVPASILSRAFDDLGHGMLKYHETLPYSKVNIPFPLKAVTECLLSLYAVFTPFTMALWTQGPLGAAWITFVQICVFWTLDELACQIEQPFSGRFKEFDLEHIHHQMNMRLASLNCLPSTFVSVDFECMGSDDIPEARPSTFSEPMTCHSLSERQLAREYKEKKMNMIDTVFDRFLERSQARAVSRRSSRVTRNQLLADSRLNERVNEIASVLSSTNVQNFCQMSAFRASRYDDFGTHSISLCQPPPIGHAMSMSPRTPERTASPRVDDGVDVNIMTGPTVRLEMIPCPDPAHTSLLKEASQAGVDV